MGLIDVHCHLLYGVDDGAKTIEDSIAMLDAAVAEGVSDIILTPHYRHGMFAYPGDIIRKHFLQLQPEAARRNLRLYLGCEYHVNSRIIEYLETKRTLPLADSEYVLTEYEYEVEASYIMEQSVLLLNHGYIPIIAHVERYRCFHEDFELARLLRRQGALIQINADAVLGMDGMRTKGFCKKMLRDGLADIVASDSHDLKNRCNHLGVCYAYISKHYGQQMADCLLRHNPGQILGL